jgi:hypothetical protein
MWLNTVKQCIFTYLIVISMFVNSRDASAFWWSDTPDTTSGLDVAAGFDINTIATVSGTIMALPERKDKEQHTVMTVEAPQGVVAVVLGPWWYWEKQTISMTKNQNVTITGSLAQGKDGVLYLFAQQLENRSTGETVTLRSETGKPLWSRGGSGTQNGNRSQSGSGQRSGTGNRGSGTRGGR